MNIIKLNAIPSTNDFLKNLCIIQPTENYTVVMAENQTKGKGQRGSTWESEANNSLTFSVLTKELLTPENSIFDLNVAVSISVIEALKEFEIPKLNIKWPNDILSEEKKIAGILIENSFAGQNISSIIGIGLNVNQTDFDNLPKASSLKNITKKEFRKEDIMHNIIEKIKKNNNLIANGKTDFLWQEYHKYLFRKDIPSVFEYPDSTKFMGIIKEVLRNGKIKISLENNQVREFDLKEIKLIY